METRQAPVSNKVRFRVAVIVLGITYLLVFFATPSAILATLLILNGTRIPFIDHLASWLFSFSMLAIAIGARTDLYQKFSPLMWAMMLNGTLLLFMMISKYA